MENQNVITISSDLLLFSRPPTKFPPRARIYCRSAFDESGGERNLEADSLCDDNDTSFSLDLDLGSNIKPTRAIVIIVPDDYPSIQAATNAANTGARAG